MAEQTPQHTSYIKPDRNPLPEESSEIATILEDLLVSPVRRDQVIARVIHTLARHAHYVQAKAGEEDMEIFLSLSIALAHTRNLPARRPDSRDSIALARTGDLPAGRPSSPDTRSKQNAG
jgi:hypothetical protein